MSKLQKTSLFWVAVSFSMAMAGALMLSTLSTSCGGGDDQVECIGDGGCPAADVCQVARCREGVCEYDPKTDGTNCQSDSVDGFCYAGFCRQDLCAIADAGATTFVPGDAANPDNPCEVCNPEQNQTGWSPLVCPAAASTCLSTPVCNATTAPVGCAGTACCVSEPAWDGTGTAPTCTFGAGTVGTCTTDGTCRGCTDAASCNNGAACTTWTCSNDQVCIATPASGSTCTYTDITTSSTSNGKCQDGVCRAACGNGGTPCPNGHYCTTDSVCALLLQAGAVCTSDAECSSGACEQVANPSGSVAQRCAVTPCPTCTSVDELGGCVPVANGQATDDCAGTCSTTYGGAGDLACVDGYCRCQID